MADSVYYTWTDEPLVAEVVLSQAERERLRDAWEARWVVEHDRLRAAAVEAEAERRAARDRARELLSSMLSRAQREMWGRLGYFHVVSQSKRIYRIHRGAYGNVRLLDKRGWEVVSFCGQPLGVPSEDVNVAQMLQLQYDEEGYLRTANASPLVGSYEV